MFDRSKEGKTKMTDINQPMREDQESGLETA
jgi:hypothetical protein